MPTTVSPNSRLIFARPDLAAASLEGRVRAARYVEPKPFTCMQSATALRATPNAAGERMNELLFGETFEVIDQSGGWMFGQCRRDRYVGYVEAASLAPAAEMAPTHWISALRTYAFAEANLRAPVAALLSMNALVSVEAEDGRFVRTAAGWVFAGHLSEIGVYRDDPVAVALEFLGAPYLWGGRESLGLDCSGLLQNALFACGISCPRDSDMQAAELGEPIDAEALARGDLVFWSGHVGIMTDPDHMVHANGYAMAVTHERLAPAIKRIELAGFGLPTSYRRLRRP